MHQIELYLNRIQHKKYTSGKAFQLTKAQIELNQAQHLVKLQLSDEDFKKLTSNLKRNKGFRFKPHMTHMAETSEKPHMGESSETIEEQAVEQPKPKKKKSVPLVKKVKATKKTESKKKRFVKGSPEAKQFMADLRSRKKIKTVEPVMEGGDIKSITKSIKRTYNNKIKPVLKTVSKQGKKLLENGIVAGIDVLSENPVIGEISRPLIKSAVNKSAKAILGVGVKHDKHPSHPVLYGQLVHGTPMSNEDIRNKKIGGSFREL